MSDALHRRIRLGLCCIFREQPIRFRHVTAAVLKRYPRDEQYQKIATICLENLDNLMAALKWVDAQSTGAFRVLSPLFPRFTHPEVGYALESLPQHENIMEKCKQVQSFAIERDIRLSLHPDQFNVLSSPHDSVVKNTLRELEYQGYLAECIGAEVINIHGGGVYANKESALKRLKSNFYLLSPRVRCRLSLENDDTSYTPEDLLPVCQELGIPLVYDIHHHRCCPDAMTEEEATTRCIESWQRLGREPYFHLSSPKNGWHAKQIRPHADYIDPQDFPSFWKDINCTVDIEAKAKELAVLRFKHYLVKG